MPLMIDFAIFFALNANQSFSWTDTTAYKLQVCRKTFSPLSQLSASSLSATSLLELLFAAGVSPGSLGRADRPALPTAAPPPGLFALPARHYTCDSQSGWRDRLGNDDSNPPHKLCRGPSVLQIKCEINTNTSYYHQSERMSAGWEETVSYGYGFLATSRRPCLNESSKHTLCSNFCSCGSREGPESALWLHHCFLLRAKWKFPF